MLQDMYDAGNSDEPCDLDLDDDEVAAQIATCHNLDVNTTEFDIVYHIHDVPPSMPEIPIYPCSQPFYETHYSALAPVNTCSGPDTCKPCHAMSEYAAVAGCPSETHIPRQILGFDGTADVGCCSLDGLTCQTHTCVADDSCDSLTGKTFTEAEQLCADNNLRLCSEHELSTGVCCDAGCDFAARSVWVSREETEPPVCCREDTPECVACRAAKHEY